MSQALFDRVVEEIRSLTPEEREKIRALLDDWDADAQRIWTEDEFEEEMERKGLLTRPKGPRPDPDNYQEPALIHIEGEPLSETIIRERR